VRGIGRPSTGKATTEMKRTPDKQKPDFSNRPPTPPVAMSEGTNREAMALVEQVDQVARDIETRWGYGRLERLTDFPLREKFDRQREKFNSAVWNGTIGDVRDHAGAMQRAWRAIEKAASAASHEPLAPRTFEVLRDDGTVVAVVSRAEEEARVRADGRAVEVWAAEDLVRLVASVPGADVAQAVLETFPGAKIERVSNRKDFNDDIPF
jgi:hypothetical protein